LNREAAESFDRPIDHGFMKRKTDKRAKQNLLKSPRLYS